MLWAVAWPGEAVAWPGGDVAFMAGFRAAWRTVPRVTTDYNSGVSRVLHRKRNADAVLRTWTVATRVATTAAKGTSARVGFAGRRPAVLAALAQLVCGVALALAAGTANAADHTSGGLPVTSSPLVIAIHGGAGTMPRAEMTPDAEARYRAGLNAALDAGYAVLERGGSSLDAVEAAVRVLEDDPSFNAGKGAVFTWDGRNELDASIMDGATRRAGAIAGVRHVKNPVTLARRVMERSPHVLLSGSGAEDFAFEQGVELVPRSYFWTERRWQQLQKFRADTARGAVADLNNRYGTVGAVALDAKGRLAAATSTGGTTGKRWGRIGDSPLIGAGTWADSRVAVSATGDGEFFIRAGVAKDIAARMQYARAPLRDAARDTIATVGELGGTGGVITLDGSGNVAFEMNSEGMFRGMRDSRGRRETAIYRE
jgi:beta-aspartyl-peptidase (threonine type)